MRPDEIKKYTILLYNTKFSRDLNFANLQYQQSRALNFRKLEG